MAGQNSLEIRNGMYTNNPSLMEKVGDMDLRLNDLQGFNENSFSYTYNPDSTVKSIVENGKNNTVISTTTFTYLVNGDIDTSTIVKNGQTIVTKYNYDSNGNLTGTVNTRL